MKKEYANNEEMEDIYEKYKNVVLQTASIYLENHIAEDIAQETFIKYFTLSKEKEIKSPRAWLVTVARNLAYNYIRDNKKIIPIDLEVTPEDFFGLAESTEDQYMASLPVEMQAEPVHIKKPMLDALYQKNKKWYNAITKAYLFDQPQLETAAEMGINLDALQSLQYRAKQWIWSKYGRGPFKTKKKKDA